MATGSSSGVIAEAGANVNAEITAVASQLHHVEIKEVYQEATKEVISEVLVDVASHLQHVDVAAQATTATGAAPAAYAMPTSGNNPDAGGSLQEQLLAIYNNPSGPAAGDSGIEISEMCKLLGGKYTMDAVLEAVEMLSNEGHVYSTITDDHHRSTSI